jgi:hypothetical protein
MVKSNAAATNVVDLEAFRQRKIMREVGRANETMSAAARSEAELHPLRVVVPVWFCWVPMWAPFVG